MSFNHREKQGKLVAFNKHLFSERMMTRQVQKSDKEIDERSENFEFPNLTFCDKRPAGKNYLVFIGLKCFLTFTFMSISTTGVKNC